MRRMPAGSKKWRDFTDDVPLEGTIYVGEKKRCDKRCSTQMTVMFDSSDGVEDYNQLLFTTGRYM